MVRRMLVLVVGGLVVALIAVGGYAAVVVVTGGPPRTAETARACSQPASVSYVDGTYAVHVRTTKVELALGPPTRPQAVVGRGPDHGVVVVLAAGTAAADVTCAWDTEGVDVIDDDGIVHRVPAAVFTGGR